MSAAAPRPLLIFPRNGNALEALDCLGARWSMQGFVDDVAEHRAPWHGHPVGDRSWFAQRPDASVLAVPGSPRSYRQRRALIEGLGIDPARWASVVHPAAHVSPLARIGRNVLIMAGVVITSNAVIGDHVCILPNTVVGHDTTIDDWAVIGAGVTLAGHVRIEANAYVASASAVRDGITVGARALVGLGSVVIADVPPDTTVAGCPARILEGTRGVPADAPSRPAPLETNR